MRPSRPLLRSPLAAIAVAITLAWSSVAWSQTTTDSTSTSSEESVVFNPPTTETVTATTHSTRIIGSLADGAPLYDTTFAAPFADATVQAGVTTARAAITTAGGPGVFIFAPFLMTASTTTSSNTTTEYSLAGPAQVSSPVEFSFGPGQITIGPRTACSGISALPGPIEPTCAAVTPTTTFTQVAGTHDGQYDDGTPAFLNLVSGGQNINVNTITQNTVDEHRTTTETTTTTETYVVRGSFLDHFVLYAVKGSKTAPKLATFGPVTLTDALGTADYDVTKLPALGLPADKNAEGVGDPDTMLAQYAVKRRKGAPKFAKIANVAASNQCGELALTLTKPDSLLVPVRRQTAPFDPLTAEVDHLLCYKVKTQTKLRKGTQVDVVDDFQTRRYDLKKPTRLCVPVTTAGTPATKNGVVVPITAIAVRHPDDHLVCYQAKAASKTIPQTGCGATDPKSKGTKIVPKQPKHAKQFSIAVNGPLGPATLDTNKEVELCIPSSR